MGIAPSHPEDHATTVDTRIRALLGVHDTSDLLGRVAEAARSLTNARFAAIGVLNEERTGLAQFVHSGIDDAEAELIGALPQGRGLLGTLMTRGTPLRVDDLGAHEDSSGFPAHHPLMTTFLGVPIFVDGEQWGALYLTEKHGGPFSDADEAAAASLAEWAAIAIANAIVFTELTALRRAHEQAIRARDALAEVAATIAAHDDLSQMLEVIAANARELSRAQACSIVLLEDGHVVVSAFAGDMGTLQLGTRVERAGTLSEAVMTRREPMTVYADDPLIQPFRRLIGANYEFESVTAYPLQHRGRPLGALSLIDSAAVAVSSARREIVESFVTSVAVAVDAARNVADQRVRSVLQAQELERTRWARELHDETLQNLGGFNMHLSALLGQIDRPELRQAFERVLEIANDQVTSLRSLITELRPLGLDDLGLGPALQDLVERVRASSGLSIDLQLDGLGDDSDSERFDPAIEVAVYRIVQEALTNIVRHAAASRVQISLAIDGLLVADVVDNGGGFDPHDSVTGFGITGMRERAALLGGSLEITVADGRTTVHVELPAAHRGDHLTLLEAEGV